MIKTQKSWQGEIGAKALCMDDEEEKESEIKSEALQMAEKLLEYARFKGNEKLSLVLSKSTDLLQLGNSSSKPETIFNFWLLKEIT